MKEIQVGSSKSSSTKRKNSPQIEKSPSPVLPILNVPLQEKDSNVLGKTSVQAGGTVHSIGK